MRFFNTSGPVVPMDHYCIPPLERVDLDDICQLVHDKRYFVLHAPRQTGKTSLLLALRDLLNRGEVGDYRCVYFNVEAGQAAREDTTRAMGAILRELASWARFTLGDSRPGEIWPGLLDEIGPYGALGEVLNCWAEADRTPRGRMELSAMISIPIASPRTRHVRRRGRRGSLPPWPAHCRGVSPSCSCQARLTPWVIRSAIIAMNAIPSPATIPTPKSPSPSPM